MSRDFDRFAIVVEPDEQVGPLLDLRGAASPGDQTELTRALEAAAEGMRAAGFTVDLALTSDPLPQPR